MREPLSHIRVSRGLGRFIVAVDLGCDIGYDTCAETKKCDDIIYATRKARSGKTRFVCNRKLKLRALFVIDKVRQPLARAQYYAELGKYTGDMSLALEAASLMITIAEPEYPEGYYTQALTSICQMQIAIRDIEGAKTTTKLMPELDDQAKILIDIAVVTGKRADTDYASYIVASIEHPDFRRYRTQDIVKAAQAISINGALGYYK